jgi:plastocyanin
MRHLTPTLRLAAIVAIAAASVAGCRAGAEPAPSSVTASPPAAYDVTLADFQISPERVVASSGPITFEVVNEGPTPHNLAVREASDEVLGTTPDLRRQQAAPLSIQLPAGEYVMFCSLPGHESLGMRSALTVAAP